MRLLPAALLACGAAAAPTAPARPSIPTPPPPAPPEPRPWQYGPVDHKVGMRPKKPYRAWCWQAHPCIAEHPDIYIGANLDLLPGGGDNTTCAPKA